MTKPSYKDVRFAEKPPYPRSVAKKDCVKEGLAFEAWAQRQLDRSGIFGQPFHSKWITYRNEGEDFDRHAQPDSFFIKGSKLFIFEMKLRHTPRSSNQLLKYRELLQALYPSHTIHLIEVYKYWDWVVYPQKNRKVSVREVEMLPQDEVGLLYLEK